MTREVPVPEPHQRIDALGIWLECYSLVFLTADGLAFEHAIRSDHEPVNVARFRLGAA